MAITKRSDKGSALTYNEMDDNFDAIAPRTSATGAIEIPAGATADRPGSASSGMLRYNTSLNSFEGYSSGAWGAIGSGGVGGGDTNQNAWSEFIVSGQTTVSADQATDAITLIAGTNMSITTDAGADSITFNATFNQDFAYSSLTGTPTIPNELTDLGITDGSSGQVLSTDGNGNFSFVAQTGGGEQGVQGFTGIQGATGTTLQGVQGFTGPSGADGADGADGDPGIQGPAGSVQGLQGLQGLDGETGAQGIQGPGNQGIQGPAAQMQGAQGADGDPGDEGPQGIQGLQGGGGQGVQGTQGLTGFDGQPGQPGPQGIAGDAQGVQGIQGNDGPAGFGNQGIQGMQGNEGPGGTGPQGTQGIQGTQGVQGNDGPEGGDGPDGPQGVQGPAGSVQGIQGFEGGQGQEGPQGIQGDTLQGISGEDGSQGIQGTDGNQGTQGLQGLTGFGNQGTQGTAGLQGVQGTGPQGLQGIQGLGNQGIQGNAGDEGSTGSQGVQGVANQGAQGMQGITLQGLQGPNGPTGLQGFQGNQGTEGLGTQGARGIQGPSDGVQGIQGNEGPIGPSGGAQGIAGIDGVDGTDGAQGIQGMQGMQGIQSIQGLTGSAGPQGVQGPTSTQGVQGPSGITGNLNNVIEDTTPQLGGNLDARNNIITNVNYIQTNQVTSTNDLVIQPGSGDSMQLGHASLTEKVLVQAGAGKALTDVANNEVMIAGSIKLNDLAFPSTDGTNGQVLTTNGSGTLSFADASGGGGLADIVEDTTPQLGGDLDVNDNLILNATGPVKLRAGTADYVTIVNTDGDDKIRFSDIGGVAGLGWYHQFGDSASNRGVVNIMGSTSGISGTGALRIYDNDSSAYIELTVPATVSTNYTLTLPSAAGANNQVLTTDGSGNLSFADASGGISNVVEDTTPQLGGNLDTNGNDIVFTTSGYTANVEISSGISSSPNGLAYFDINLPYGNGAGEFFRLNTPFGGAAYDNFSIELNENFTAGVVLRSTGDLKIAGDKITMDAPVVFPSYTTAERDAISNPVAGMVVFNTTTSVLNFYNGSSWAAV